MGLLDKVKESLKRAEEGISDEVADLDEDELDSFTFYEKKWVLSPFMAEIKKGDFEKIPIECMLTHYILKSDNCCYYITLMDEELGNEYGIYEFEWMGEDMSYNGETLEPEFKEIQQGMSSVDCAKFLGEKLGEGYDIYIEERIEFERV